MLGEPQRVLGGARGVWFIRHQLSSPTGLITKKERKNKEIKKKRERKKENRIGKRKPLLLVGC